MKQDSNLRWPPWILIGTWMIVSIGNVLSIPAPHQASLRPDGSRRTMAVVNLLVRELLRQTTAIPGIGSRLERCVEFTKPDSLKIRMMGTPKNHRSPPA